MEQLILRLTFISLTALIMSCSRRFDSQSNAEHETADTSEQIADHHGTAHPRSQRPAQSANPTEGGEREAQPSADDIGEDCHAFVWLTKSVPRDGANADCPQCPSSTEAKQVLNFRAAQVERVSCVGETCEVAVAIHASFNPSNGGTIRGGLEGWIPLEQREEYSRGQTPGGEQVYHLKIIYKRDGEGWRPVDFG
jgi:hypothetical protein